jgi:hypothetical protein
VTEAALLLLAVLVCLGVAATAATVAGGPAPVVVIGEPGPEASPYDGGYLTIEVLASHGHQLRSGQATVDGPDGRAGVDLGPGTHRLALDGAGPHRVSWTVSASGGGTTAGSMLLA